MSTGFEATIGLEVHCQLATDSKIFCSCPAKAPAGVSVSELEPNSHVCPICAGHPGTLPVLNKKVVEYAILAGLATHCSIRLRNRFARKNYFYPDLPKGYQISQYEQPICEDGYLDIPVSETAIKRVKIQRIHMEEDAGKNVHRSGYSLVNLNRAGVPLVEIVSGPEMSSPAEAGAYLRALHAVVTFLGISDGNMQEGNFRCDANVSIRPVGARELGTRVEIKNVNSFRFVEKAIEHEISRQISTVSSGGRVVQETRLYDADKNATFSMRSKEEAMDYRYFPDPDLIPLQLEQAWVDQIREKMPELPEQKRARFVAEFGLSPSDAAGVTMSKSGVAFFEATVRQLVDGGMDAKTAAKPAANWLAGEISRLSSEDGIELDQSKITPQHLAELVRLTHAQVVSSTGAKQALSIAWKTGRGVTEIVEKEGLKQVSDTGALEPIVDKVIAAFPAQVADYRAGKEKLLGFFVGQIMKEMGGKANPALLQELLKKKL